MKLHLIFPIFLLWLLCNCKRESADIVTPTEPSPCATYLADAAKFDFFEAWDNARPDTWIDYPTDTVMFYYINIKAKDTKCKSYTWYLGADTIKNQSSIIINFGGRPSWQNVVPVKLRVVKAASTQCGVPRDTILEFTKNIVFVHDRDSPPPGKEEIINPYPAYYSLVNGTWQGEFSNNPGVLHTINFSFKGYHSFPVYWTKPNNTIGIDTQVSSIVVSNALPTGETRYYPMDTIGDFITGSVEDPPYSYREFIFSAWRQVPLGRYPGYSAVATALVSQTSRDSISIFYNGTASFGFSHTKTPPDSLFTFTFTGKRIK